MQLTEKQKSEGWRIVKFGDVAQEVKGSTKDPLAEGIDRYIGLEHIDTESLRLSRWGSIAEDNPTFTKKFSAGDILFGRRRAYLKKAAVADFDGICSGDIIVISSKGKALIPELLPFIVQSEPFFDWAVKHSAGGLSPRTKFKSLAEFEFPLPPRPRQEEMLEIFERIEKSIQLCAVSYDSASSLNKTIIRDVINNKRSKPITLKELGKWKGGGTPSKNNSKYWENGNILWVSPKDMDTKLITESIDKITDEALKNSSAQLLPKQSILFVTRSGVLRHTLPIAYTTLPCTVNQDIKALIVDEKANNSKFVWAVLKLYAEDIRHRCSKIGTTVESINSDWLKKYQIKLPPKEIQDQAIITLEYFSESQEELLKKISSTKAIKNKFTKMVLEGAP